MITHRFTLACLLTLTLVACGGGESAAPDAATPAAGASSSSSSSSSGGTGVPGGVYIGYYLEDAINNPEDPTPGALYMNLPEGNASFSGSMYFTYIGCQSSNVGVISGTKQDLDLSGTWSGDVDASPQSGGYTGVFSTAQSRYSGTYTVSGGKQYRNLQPCIDYYIAAHGTWELFPADTTVTSGASSPCSVSGKTISWAAPTNSDQCVVAVIDRTAASYGASTAVVWQTGVPGDALTAVIPPSVSLPGGNQLTATVTCTENGQRNYFSSKSFTAP